ncbi:MAG: DUF1905 domain-containing protein [Minisyncoccia bacterium]
MKSFEVKGKVWRYPGLGGWHCLYVPQQLSQRLRDMVRAKQKTGVAFVRIKATVGKTSWNTTLFPTKDGPYLLAIKAEVRHKEGIAEGDMTKISCILM